MEIRRNSGFGLIEVLIAGAILSLLGVGIMQISTTSLKVQVRSNTSSSLDLIKRNFIAQIENDTAWQNTISDPINSSFACLRGTPSPCTENGIPLTDKTFRLKDAAGNIVYDPLSNPSVGFTNNGAACTGFSATGNDDCPIQYSLTWSAICAGACISPQMRVTGTMVNKPTAERTIALNSDNYSFTIVRNLTTSGSATSPHGKVLVKSSNSPYAFVVPSGVTSIWLSMCGGGGGGAADGPPVNGQNGGNSTFGTIRNTRGGFGGTFAACCWTAGVGGAPGGPGGMYGTNGYTGTNPQGGGTQFGVGGADTTGGGCGAGRSGTGYGSGGASGSDCNNVFGGSGGGAECIFADSVTVISGSTYTITIGNGGAGGALGNPYAGGSGAPGFALIEW